MITAKYFKYDEEYNLRPIYNDDVVEVVRCKDCKHSIKKDYNGVIPSYEYLCILKSTVTHLEEHEANYFCAAGERKEIDE